MTRGLKVITTILVILVGVLAIGTGYFYAKSANLEKQAKPGTVTTSTSIDQADNQSLDQTPDQTATPSPTPTPAATTTKTVTTSPKPTATVSAKPTPTPSVTTSAKPKAGAAGTYTVKAGDTMFSIASGLGVNWLDLAKANGLDATTANKIIIGQVLVVPTK